MESCSKSLEVAKASFLELLSQCCNDNDRQLFLNWIVEEVNSEITENSSVQNYSLQYQKLADNRLVLGRISSYIRDIHISEASSNGKTANGSVWNSENIRYPTKFGIGGDSETGLTPQNTLHLDSFLYDEADEDMMIENGELSRSFCKGNQHDRNQKRG